MQRVRDAAKEWQAKAEDERYLMQGGLLAEVREQWPAVCELAPATRHFYERSDAQEKEQVAFLERALAESELREQALKVMNLTSARPMEAAAMAIHSTGASHQTLQGRIIAPVQGRLRTIIDRVREYQRCQGHEDAVNSVALSPDGQTIVSGSADRTVRLWRGGTWRDWLALCCNRFRYHPLFQNADREPFISACKVCEEHVWSK